MSRSRPSWRLRLALCSMTFLTGAHAHAQAAAPPLASARGEPSGSDVFVMAREAILRDKPSKESRLIGKLPGGARLKLLDAGETWDKVEVIVSERPAGASKDEPKSAPSAGFVSRDVVATFPDDASGLSDLIAAGRVLSQSEPHRRFAAAFLLRASERQRASGAPDPTVELLLGRDRRGARALWRAFPSRPRGRARAGRRTLALFGRGISPRVRVDGKDRRRQRRPPP